MKNFKETIIITIPFVIIIILSIVNIHDLKKTKRQIQVSADTSAYIIEDTSLCYSAKIDTAGIIESFDTFVIYASKKAPVKIIFDNGETLTTDMEKLIKKVLKNEK